MHTLALKTSDSIDWTRTIRTLHILLNHCKFPSVIFYICVQMKSHEKYLTRSFFHIWLKYESSTTTTAASVVLLLDIRYEKYFEYISHHRKTVEYYHELFVVFQYEKSSITFKRFFDVPIVLFSSSKGANVNLTL